MPTSLEYLFRRIEEVLSSVSPIMDAHPEKYEKVDLLKRMVEPERMFTFRVCWMDDKGEYHTNRGWRCQFNGAIGPYKGGLRFQKNVYEGIIVPRLRADLQELPDRLAHGRRKGRLRPSIPPASLTQKSCVSARA